jgi:hypothetical protein
MADPRIVHPEGEFTVHAVKADEQGEPVVIRRWGDENKNRDYLVHLRNGNPENPPIEKVKVTLFAANQAPPRKGDRLTGHIQDSGYGLEFRAKKKGGNWGGRGGGGDFKRDPEAHVIDREKNAAMAMESAFKTAQRLLRDAIDTGYYKPPTEGPASDMAHQARLLAEEVIYPSIKKAADAAAAAERQRQAGGSS